MGHYARNMQRQNYARATRGQERPAPAPIVRPAVTLHRFRVWDGWQEETVEAANLLAARFSAAMRWRKPLALVFGEACS